MKIYDLEFEAIERVEPNVSDAELHDLVTNSRKPLIIPRRKKDLEFLDRWTLDRLSKVEGKVRTQRPESDGVNYFHKYFMMDMAELSDRIGQGEDLYAGARPVLGSEGKPTDKGGLLDLANELRVPAWIDQSTIYNANLWLGAGDNRTMLHYDAWNTIMLVGKGSKEFFVFPNTESHKMFQYSAFNYAALLRGQVLHSPIRPLSVQKKYQSKFRTAKGFQGRAESGDIIFVPAGFWHYVESTGLNISVNFFTHYADRSLQWKEPLLTYWVKVNITEKPIEWYQNLRAWVGRLVRGLLNNPARKPN